MTPQSHSGDVAVLGSSDREMTGQQSRHTVRKTGRGSAWLIQVAAMLGIGILVYSSAADWFATRGHNAEVSGYIDRVTRLPDEDKQALFAAAAQYNSQLPSGVLKDPYTHPTSSSVIAETDYRDYLGLLLVEGQSVLGELSYPKLGIALPIYHGTDDAVLNKGVGHLYGSSVPTGGPSTHAVMTSHSGLVNAALFTALPDAQVDDVFTVRILGEQHFYQVRRLETVLPHETQSLEIIHGEDWVTLITCTPIGVNSHRLLVQAQRVEAPADGGHQALAGDGKTTGFPWWAVWFLGGSAAAGYFIFVPSTKSSSDANTVQQKAAES